MNLVNSLKKCNKRVLDRKNYEYGEVYRTNVENQKQAEFLLKHLYQIFPDYRINFDLEDCDKILRVESSSNPIEVFQVIVALAKFGFTATVLEDSPNI